MLIGYVNNGAKGGVALNGRLAVADSAPHPLNWVCVRTLKDTGPFAKLNVLAGRVTVLASPWTENTLLATPPCHTVSSEAVCGSSGPIYGVISCHQLNVMGARGLRAAVGSKLIGGGPGTGSVSIIRCGWVAANSRL